MSSNNIIPPLGDQDSNGNYFAPAITKASIGLIVAFSLFTIVGMCEFIFRRVAHLQGIRTGRSSACAGGGLHAPKFIFLGCIVGIILKIAALAVNIWGSFSNSSVRVRAGLFSISSTSLSVQNFDFEQEWNWTDLCNQGEFDNTSCHTIQVAGILTLCTGLPSLLLTISLVVCSAITMFKPLTRANHAPKMYRIGGCILTCTVAALGLWAFGAYLTLRHLTNGALDFGASGWVFLTAVLLDGFLFYTCREILLTTPPSSDATTTSVLLPGEGGSGAAPTVPTVVYTGYVAPQPVYPFVGYPHQQQQPPPPAYSPPRYGQNSSPQQFTPQYAAGHTPYQPLPAFNPNR